MNDNFFNNLIFKYENNKCDIVEDLIHDTPFEEPRQVLKTIDNNSGKVSFAYAPNKGLVRLSSNGSIEEENILGKLITIPTKNKKYLEQFVKKNGFIFPVSKETYDTYEEDQILQIIERLRITVELMSEITATRKNYEKIFINFIKLLLYPSIEIKNLYHSSSISLVDSITDYHKDYPDDFDEVAFKQDYYTVKDTIYGSFDLDVEYYQNVISNHINNNQVNDPLYRGIIKLYLNYTGTEIERKIIDFLYHYFNDVGMINSHSFNYYEKPNKKGFSDKLKKQLLEITKYLISEEINKNIQGLHPYYDSNTMSPTWKIDNLLCAAYFSVFYLKQDMELLRLCANPNCGIYFKVNATSTNKKYCSPECCNRVQQYKHRKRKLTIN